MLREAQRMTPPLDVRAAGGRRLKDKVCIVTGAGQGIGRATARRLGEEGGIIVIADRVDATASEAEAELRDHGVAATKLLIDLSTFSGAQELMTRTKEIYGRVAE
jgi:NAD(P)-dependent dehydrogenase (short-subunit alcohol dehydrogenase family)